MSRQPTNLAVPAVALAALVACGPAHGTSDGEGSATAASTGKGSSGGSASGATTVASECPESDLPPPFCHVAQSYGSTLETDGNLVPAVLLPLLSPGQAARLLIDIEGEFRLVDAQDFAQVYGTSDASLYGGINMMNFMGDFNGDGVCDLGVVDSGHPVELYDGNDLSLLATGLPPQVPSHGNEFPSGTPAAAIDADGDGIDEVLTVELGHDIGVWRVVSNTLEPVANHRDVMLPCPGAFLRDDFDGDGDSEIALLMAGASCWDGLDLEDAVFTIKLIPSPMPGSLAELTAVDQASGAHARASGDLDGDGMADVVLEDPDRLVLLRSTGAGFEILEVVDWADLGANGALSSLRAVGDIDGDGRADIMLSVRDDATNSSEYRVHWEGTLGGTSYAFPSGLIVRGLADLNGDGRAEILASQSYPNVGREELIYWSR